MKILCTVQIKTVLLCTVHYTHTHTHTNNAATLPNWFDNDVF